ncbi:MAG: amidase [Hyphomicrobiales bacterium]|nr:amidase [Hyphomicrobiales bacterium]
MSSELIGETATDLVSKLRRGEVSPHDCLDALEARIREVDGAVNALPTLCMERAREKADAVLRLAPEKRGLLAGLPVPIKDLSNVAGVRSTQGSPIFANFVPERSDIVVEMIEAQGGIVYAKSNTPEFGAGASTFNEVFGSTKNPYDVTRSAAGSSGGAAAALASGTAWLAHGSDMGGSLRNPASFCGVVGMRPSVGRCANDAKAKIDQNLGVQGPMARTVEDLALFLDAMSGFHPGAPLSLPRDAQSFISLVRSGWKPKRVAYSADLGITPVDPEVAACTRDAAFRLAEEGVIVEEAHPNFTEAHECFQILRAQAFAVSYGGLLTKHGDLLKPEVIWNIEKGFRLTAAEIAKAEHQRVALFQRTSRFFETYDLLLTPATICAAFPVGERYLAECDGHRFETYIDWLAIAYAITLVFCPALSLPCGFTKSGLPIGLQICAPAREEGRILAAAKLLEDKLGLGTARPIDPRLPKAA